MVEGAGAEVDSLNGQLVCLGLGASPFQGMPGAQREPRSAVPGPRGRRSLPGLGSWGEVQEEEAQRSGVKPGRGGGASAPLLLPQRPEWPQAEV